MVSWGWRGEGGPWGKDEFLAFRVVTSMQFNDGFKNLVLHPSTIFFLVHGESDFLDFEAGLFGYSHVKSKNFNLE